MIQVAPFASCPKHQLNLLSTAYQAAIWFGSRELAMATAMGVFGNQLGVGLGFLVPPQLVPDPQTISDDLDKMEEMTKGWLDNLDKH